MVTLAEETRWRTALIGQNYIGSLAKRQSNFAVNCSAAGVLDALADHRPLGLAREAVNGILGSRKLQRESEPLTECDSVKHALKIGALNGSGWNMPADRVEFRSWSDFWNLN
jgi:hypothetical protein